MNRKEIESIKDSIKMHNNRLRTIQPHLKEENITLNETFNKLLIEKAILRDKLNSKTPSLFSKIVKKLKSSKKELICDYFN